MRAFTFVSGYYLEKISDNTTKICTVSQTDIGGNIPKVIINAVAAKAPKDWILNLIKGCKSLKNK